MTAHIGNSHGLPGTTSRVPISAASRRGRRAAPAPRLTERDRALDRIQAVRAVVARKSLWLKRGSVGGVTLAIGVGVLQGWPPLHLLAIPLAALFWWLDARLTRTDRRIQQLYDSVFEGATPPPFPGEEFAAAGGLPEPPNAMRRALLSGPGTGLHLMMAGLAVVFNVLI